MSKDLWTAVDHYTATIALPPDPVLEATLRASDEGGLPAIQVSPHQGKMLHLWAASMGARRILEIGTLGGYSTIWLARALPAGGRLVTLEVQPKHAEVARANLAQAGFADVVEVRLGVALESLAALAAEGGAPFDFVFIDADKINTAAYFEWALTLTRVGGVIVVDNVIRGGAVLDATSGEDSVVGIRRFNERLAAERRVSATVIQTVSGKGYDGMTIALVTGE
ncbi:MAG TPA: O-methyltransferase [Aggregatilineales bacterium]|nr:O-methyltransferase [Anaerolineales bacterium]HRE48695.1 O-methyltransferase [Aggregatilineales bacterium]